MKAKEVIQSDMHIKNLKVIKIFGHTSIYDSLKVLNVGLQGFHGPQSTSQDLPFNSGEVTILYGPRPPSMDPVHKVQKASIWSFGLPGTLEKLVLGDSNNPHGLQIATYRPYRP
ncbi:hypothetical protein O181_009980 [Austropuccinia psidii MF-1]|uniref:Uncharacterized protein n=1 Tax=Austropuccinia psidii MF-1 TaxID=1389203 RepID=A0A9Q3BT03_9BASI|nr:hypothetical protein [Austropuccinia psidii MF-1]